MPCWTISVYGLAPNERILGIDYRVARGVLFALGSSDRVFTVDVHSGALKPVGDAPFALALAGAQFGFDFNPAADRIRIVSDSGQNLRAHPETGALADFKPDADGVQSDGALAFRSDDVNAAHRPRIIAAAHTYNTARVALTTRDAPAPTLYRIDLASGQAYPIGAIGKGEPLRGIAIEPRSSTPALAGPALNG